MQIRMFTENNMHVTAGKAAQIKKQQLHAVGDNFGPQCRVTISREGRKLSEQSGTHTAKSAQSLKAEKILLRQQEQAGQAEDTKNEYLDLLEEIEKTVKSLNGSFQARADDETAEKKAQVLRAMREQKQKQLEENQKKQKEAQQLAMQSSEVQDEIDQNNRDLLVMLKSLEEAEKDEEEEEKNGGGSTEEGSAGAHTENSVSDVIQNAAVQFGASSARRELNVVGMIDALNADGHYYLDKADEIMRNILDESESIKELLADEGYTDAEKEETVMRFREMAMGGYGDLFDYRGRGLQMLQDARDARIQHIADNPLQGMEETKESMMQSAVDAAINEASQGKLDEASQALQDEVDELVDKRNDVDRVESDEGKEQEEQPEAIGENIKTADGE